MYQDKTKCKVKPDWRLLLMLSLLALAVSTGFAAENPAALKQKLFSDFSGNSKSLSDYVGKGKWVIVMIWAHDCHACNLEAKNYAALHNKHYKANRATLLGISVDGKNVSAAKQFIKKHNVTFQNLIVSRSNMDSFLTTYVNKKFVGTPTFMVFSRKGKFEGLQPGAIPAALLDTYLLKNDK